MTPAPRSESGMTLVEVMISAVVLSMVVLALAASLRTFATTYSAVEQSADRTARLREVTYFLRHAVREANLPYAGAFHSEAGQLTWLAPMDRVGAAGGMTWMRLRHQGESLMLDFAIPDTEKQEKALSDPAWGTVIASEVLLDGIRGLQVTTLFGPNEEQADRQKDEVSNELPAGVSISWQAEGVDWPPLVVALDGYRGDE